MFAHKPKNATLHHKTSGLPDMNLSLESILHPRRPFTQQSAGGRQDLHNDAPSNINIRCAHEVEQLTCVRSSNCCDATLANLAKADSSVFKFANKFDARLLNPRTSGQRQKNQRRKKHSKNLPREQRTCIVCVFRIATNHILRNEHDARVHPYRISKESGQNEPWPRNRI